MLTLALYSWVDDKRNYRRVKPGAFPHTAVPQHRSTVGRRGLGWRRGPGNRRRRPGFGQAFEQVQRGAVAGQLQTLLALGAVVNVVVDLLEAFGRQHGFAAARVDSEFRGRRTGNPAGSRSEPSRNWIF